MPDAREGQQDVNLGAPGGIYVTAVRCREMNYSRWALGQIHLGFVTYVTHV